MNAFGSLFGKRLSPTRNGKTRTDGVTFRDTQMQNGNRYEIYTASSRQVALSFLRSQDVREERRYIIVESPDGNVGRDLIMIFDEATGKMLEFGKRSPLPELVSSPTACARCGYTVLPAGPTLANTAGDTLSEVFEMIVIDQLKTDGVGFVCTECDILWCPFCVQFRGSDPVCAACGSKVRLFRETSA